MPQMFDWIFFAIMIPIPTLVLWDLLKKPRSTPGFDIVRMMALLERSRRSSATARKYIL